METTKTPFEEALDHLQKLISSWGAEFYDQDDQYNYERACDFYHKACELMRKKCSH